MELPKTAKKIFKRLRLGELSLVDEPCIPGSDIEIKKAKLFAAPSPDDDESTTKGDEVEGQRSPGGEASESELVEKALAPYHDLLGQLQYSRLSVADFLTAADAEASRLKGEAETGGDPVAKSAAQTALSILTESTVNLAELNAAYGELQTRVETVQAESNVAKSRAAAAEAEVADLKAQLAAKDEEIAKAKPAKSQAEQDEEVLKALPEHLREEVLKARKAAEDAEIDAEVAKAKDMGLAEPEVVGKALRDLRKANPEATETVEKALKARAAVAKESEAIFKSFGVSTDKVGDDPEAQLKALAEPIAKSKGITAEAAFLEAAEANPALYDQYVAKRRAAFAGAN